MLTYAIYRNVPPITLPAFSRARDGGVIETFEHRRHSLDDSEIILKWRGEQPGELIPGLILFTGNHEQILQKLLTDQSLWDPAV